MRNLPIVTRSLPNVIEHRGPPQYFVKNTDLKKITDGISMLNVDILIEFVRFRIL